VPSVWWEIFGLVISEAWMFGRPVIAQSINADDTCAQVVLGADDRHLRFRSCVSVEVHDDGRIVLSLGTRVQCNNFFGRIYMTAIDAVHRGYVTPAMLRLAADHAIRVLSQAAR